MTLEFDRMVACSECGHLHFDTVQLLYVVCPLRDPVEGCDCEKDDAQPEAAWCAWCNGYGSSLKDPDGVDTCTRCGGSVLARSVS